MSSIDEIQKRLDAAPDGDWYVEDGAVWVDHTHGERDSTSGLTGMLPIWAVGAADFIAHAPSDVARLVAALEAVEKLHAGWEHDAPDALVLLLVRRTREAVRAALGEVA